MLNKKISAFTLTEMLIVLIISVIIAGLAFTVITLFGKNIHTIENNYSASNQFRLLEQQLTIDFNRYHFVTFNENIDELKLKTPIDSISYKFEDEYLVRENDTVLKEKYNKKFLFMGEEVKNGLIDALEIEISNNKIKKGIFVFKENDASTFLNN